MLRSRMLAITHKRKIGSKTLLQLGVAIPVYILTEKGKRPVLAYLTEFKDNLAVFRTNRLPYLAKNKGPRLKGYECDEEP